MTSESIESLGEELFGRVEAARQRSPTRGLRLARQAEKRLTRRTGPARGRASAAWQRGRLARAAGHALRALGRHVEALRAYDAAAAHFRRSGDAIESARCGIGRVDALMYLGRYEAAEREGAVALRVLEQGRQRAVAARLLNNLANLDYRRDRPERALARYARARPGLAAMGAAALGRVDANRANCLALRGRPEEAARLLGKARRAFQSAALPVDAAACDYALAYLLFLRHRYIDALFALESLESVFERLRASDYRALLDLDAAEILLRLGRPEEAERSAARAAERAESLGLRYERSKAIYFEAVAAASRGDLDTARRLLAGAARGFVGERNRVWAAQCLLAVAECDLGGKRTAAAESRAERAAKEFGGENDDERAGLAWVLAGRAAHAGGRRAHRHLARARRSERRARSAFLSFRVACLAGDAAFRARRPDRARRAYAKAARLSESLAGRVRSELFRATDWTAWEDAYPRLVALELAAGRTAKAFHALERGRARAFELSREEAPGRRSRARWPASLRRRLEGLACRIESRRWRRAAAPGEDGVATSTGEREERETARLLERLEREARRARGARAPEPVLLDRLQRSLEPGERLVEYFEVGGAVHALAIDRDRMTLHPGLAQRSTIDGWLEEIDYLARAGVRRAARAAPAIAAALREAASRLVAPWAAGDPGLARAVIVPAGRMARLPWPALLREATGRAIPVSAAPSASSWRAILTRGWKEPRGGVVLVGAGDGQLPEVEREIEEIARGYPRARVLVGREATVDRLRRALVGADWLHVAGHGRADAERPILAGIRLADRWAHVPDLLPNGRAPRGVVLSACRTGEMVGGWRNDWRGLAGSLLAAGSHAVVASLWEADDAGARRLTATLYRHLAAGDDLGTALARSQEESTDKGDEDWNAWTWGLFGMTRAPGPLGPGPGLVSRG